MRKAAAELAVRASGSCCVIIALGDTHWRAVRLTLLDGGLDPRHPDEGGLGGLSV